MFKINKIDTNNKNFINILKKLLIKNDRNNNNIEKYIKNIIYNVKKYKEKALLYYSKKFDNIEYKNIKEISINEKDLEKSFYKLNLKTRFMLEYSKNRIEVYHEKQKNNFKNSWKIYEKDGTSLGQKTSDIEKVGFYIPGGKAVYPSSVFMNIIPSKISNNKNIYATFPKKKNNEIILATLFLCGIKKVYTLGGIHGLAAMAYGTNIVEKVDKICGPGNIFISLTKKYIYGDVGIDSLAGPSEVTILSNSKIPEDILSIDLISQSEHDKISQSILISNNIKFILNIENFIKKFISFLLRKKIVYNSIFNKSILIKTKNLKESINLVNFICPEHLIISYKNSENIFKYIKNSGSTFLSYYCSESFGDYTSGLNHVIPTNKNCKFSSPLGIYNFYKILNFLNLKKKNFNKLKKITLSFSNKENLFSHKESVDIRNYF